nr:MAG TPA: hypothetical protein [Caudoviricetes sp.]
MFILYQDYYSVNIFISYFVILIVFMCFYAIIKLERGHTQWAQHFQNI